MARGQPDYGGLQQQYAIAGMADLGEAVARLDSINIFDRRGFTIWQDNFEAPSLKWTATQVGGIPIPVLSTATAFSGVQSVLLSTPAGIPNENLITRVFPLIRLGRIGMEFWIQGEIAVDNIFRAYLRVYDGTIPSWAELRFNLITGTISLWTPTGAVVVATSIYMQQTQFYFLPVKLVVDINTDYYVRLLVGEREFDISAYRMDTAPASPDRYVFAQFRLLSDLSGDSHMYIDNFILTQNEP